MSEQPLHETERFKSCYSKCVDDINHAWHHYETLRRALHGYEHFDALDRMLRRGFEATRVKLEAQFLEDVWSIYYDIYERPRAMAEYKAYEAAHPGLAWKLHPLNPDAKNPKDKPE